MKAFDQLKERWERDPLTVIAVGAGAVVAVTGVINAMSAAQGRRAYAKQVDYRVKRPY